MMRLLVISHTAHYRRATQWVGWGPTVREIDELAKLFTQVVHLAPVHDQVAPGSALPYLSGKVTVRGVAPAGGKSVRQKLDILRSLPAYWGAMRAELPRADVVHVRCPANISLLAVVWLGLVRRPRLRWVKYAGNWRPQPSADNLSYAFQRWWLKRGLHRGLVTINGSWPGQPPHVRSFFNPCLTSEELAEARRLAASRPAFPPVRLLLVGRLEAAKGVGQALEVLARLQRQGVPASLDLVGDGDERPAYEHRCRELGLTGVVSFRGWMPRAELAPIYARSHCLLLPTSNEGWPKVLSEGMAYGAVPLTSAVSCIPQYLAAFGTGQAIANGALDEYCRAIAEYVNQPATWMTQSRNAMEAATSFTYAAYLKAVGRLLGLPEPASPSSEPALSQVATEAAG
jgi:glycosyltransferase involved in cell wall biosynthesis